MSGLGNILARVVYLSIVLLTLTVLTGGCTDNLGTCTIAKSGKNQVYEEITIDECQYHYENTPGASGWTWDPGK
jgi:hypothetical protein